MKGKLWGFVKFCVLLGIKIAPRLIIAPWVGAVRGMLEEKDRIDAEINAELDAYMAREFKEES